MEGVIDLSPMGCRTGFYFTSALSTLVKAAQLTITSIRFEDTNESTADASVMSSSRTSQKIYLLGLSVEIFSIVFPSCPAAPVTNIFIIIQSSPVNIRDPERVPFLQPWLRLLQLPPTRHTFHSQDDRHVLLSNGMRLYVYAEGASASSTDRDS